MVGKGKELFKKSSQNALSHRAMALALEEISQEDVQVLIQYIKNF